MAPRYMHSRFTTRSRAHIASPSHVPNIRVAAMMMLVARRVSSRLATISFSMASGRANMNAPSTSTIISPLRKPTSPSGAT